MRHDLAWGRQMVEMEFGLRLIALIRRCPDVFLKQDTLAQLDTMIADENTIRTGDQSLDFIMPAAAKGTPLVGWGQIHALLRK
jgi:hypothetical protein